MSIMRQTPSFILATHWASDLLLLPVNEELAVVKTFSFGGSSRHWTKQLDLIVLSAAHQRLGIHLSTSNQMKLGKHIMLCEVLMNILHGFSIRPGRLSSDHLDDQIGSVRLTGFAQMHLVASPDRVALPTVACFDIIRRGDHLSGRRPVLILSPWRPLGAGMVVLDPDEASRLDCREVSQPWDVITGVDCF